MAIAASFKQLIDHRLNLGNAAGLGFDWEGPRLVEKLSAAPDLEQLLLGLLTQVGGELGDHAHHPLNQREAAYFPAIGEATLRLLQASSPDCAPEVCIDAILRICNRSDHTTQLRAKANLDSYAFIV